MSALVYDRKLFVSVPTTTKGKLLVIISFRDAGGSANRAIVGWGKGILFLRYCVATLLVSKVLRYNCRLPTKRNE